MKTPKIPISSAINRGCQLLLQALTCLLADTTGNAQPRITQQPAPQSVSLNASAFFRVIATSQNRLTYQWLHQDIPLASATNASLILTNILMTDAGVYTVIAADADGAITSQPALLEVDPTFSKVTTGPLVTEKAHWHAAAWADYDNDGCVDLFLNQHEPKAKNILYRNNGEGTFSPILDPSLQGIVTPSGIYGAAWGDYDNDGHFDLFLANTGAKNALLHNRGDGTFERLNSGPGAEGAISMSATWGDYDRDGYLDLLVVNSDAGRTSAANWLYHNLTDGTFSKTSSNQVGTIVSDRVTAFFASWIDYDDDGWMDLFLGKSAYAKSWFYRNLGSQRFIRTTNNTTLSADAFAWGDYDNDGKLDLFLAGSPHSLYHNEGAGVFTRMSAAHAGSPATDRLQAVGGGVTWGDYDNDGFLDLFVAGGRTWGMSGIEKQRCFFYQNHGDGTFARITNGSPANDLGEAMGVYWVDYNRDGFLDLFVQDEGVTFAPNRLYWNTGNSNSWLEVNCVGTSSPRFGTGAKVRAKATIGGKTTWQLRLIDAGGTCWGGQSFTAHFGLGDATVVDTLRIEWPSGIVQELRQVPARQFLTVTEPPRLEMAQAGALTVRSWKGQCFRIETSPDLRQWQLKATLTNQSDLLVYQESAASSPGACFYRVGQR